MEVNLGPGVVVLDGVAAPPKRGTAPSFHSMSIVAKQLDEETTWYGSRPRPRPHCVRRVPAPPRKAHSSLPSFRPMSIVATVAHLSYCWALVKANIWRCLERTEHLVQPLPLYGHIGLNLLHFSGPGKAVGPVCVCVWTITFELNDFDLDIWHAGLSCQIGK